MDTLKRDAPKRELLLLLNNHSLTAKGHSSTYTIIQIKKSVLCVFI